MGPLLRVVRCFILIFRKGEDVSAAGVRKGELIFEEGFSYASSQGFDLRSDTDLERMCEIVTAHGSSCTAQRAAASLWGLD